MESIDISKCSCGHLNLHFGCATYHVRPCELYSLLIDISFKDREVLHNALVLSLNEDCLFSQSTSNEKKILLRFGMNLVELHRFQLLNFILKCWKNVPDLMHRVIAKSIDESDDMAWMA